ncbi:unnamed protein product [Eruca vesicaria subsp. sativa]|uniref:3'-5' exonuclease domain-containing protein n=1 Tax=Eruca vesicaria subsp. sativa TaxID=29727 RepID=A0ABC8JHV6_ERUVS|nr:unnamed protein product [Eruca vesicaria subsp. sativa]
MSSMIVDLGGTRIETTVTREPSEINRLVMTFLSNDKFGRNKIIGLDTERARSFSPKTVLLQLCDGDYCLIIQLSSFNHVKLPLSLYNFLNLPDFTFVGIGMNKSLKMLESEFGLTCKNAVEIGPPKRSLMTYNMHYLNITRADIVQNEPASPIFGDWGASVLSENQIILAVSNAYLAFGLGNNMLEY